jgi:hypothetical protein
MVEVPLGIPMLTTTLAGENAQVDPVEGETVEVSVMVPEKP